MLIKTGEATALRIQAKQEQGRVYKTTLDFCRCLWTIHSSFVRVGKQEVPLYSVWGFESWEEYVETELGFHYSTATGYVNVWDTFFVRFGDTVDKTLLPKSITKLKALAKVVKHSDVNAWLRKANKMTCCEVDHAIEISIYGGRSRRTRTLHAPVDAKGLDTINAAVLALREEMPEEGRGDAIAIICDQWLKIHKKTKLRRVA